MLKRILSTRFAMAVLLGSAGLLLPFFAGCGGSDSKTGAEPKNEASGSTPPAAIAAPKTADAAADSAQPTEIPLPKEGSPEWIVGQMIVLRADPLANAKTPQEREAQLRERSEKLVRMAQDVIAATHKDKSKEAVFNSAVHFLVEARLELAIAGTPDDAKALYDDAADLYKRDPNSPAAAQAAYTVTRLAHTNARRFAKTKPRSIQDFAVQAKLFATRFPNDPRAVNLLFVAGQTCELHQLRAEAVSCYVLLQEKFAKTPQAEQAAGVLRRLDLKGKRLEFGGETPVGERVRIEQFKGKPVLIVFWSSDSEPFVEMLPELKNVLRRYEKSGLAVIGVCLDESETTLDAFTEKNGLSWTQIFFADQDKRHWDHPVVRYYGVREVPSLWLVNRDGVVVDTQVTLEALPNQLRDVMASGGRENRE
jgi:peroxiredoxin